MASRYSPSGITDFDQIEALFSDHGVKRLYIKKLATRQDNTKNQIVLASKGDQAGNSIGNIFPATPKIGSPSVSEKKAHSLVGVPKIEYLLDFYWLDASGQAFKAPGTKIINYFQYPEARLSGFFNRCAYRPEALKRKSQADFGTRVLFLGANDLGQVFGLVVTEKDDPVIQELPRFSQSSISVLSTHLIGSALSPDAALKAELLRHIKVWHPSISLKPAMPDPQPFRGNQGAGFTLEALLGIPRNASKAPDKYGFEIKSFRDGGKISLFTPTADQGAEADLSFRDFMARYGWRGARDDRQTFLGPFRYRKPKSPPRCAQTYMLDMPGYGTGNLVGQGFPVELRDSASGMLLSGWSFEKLLKSWTEKHSQACYVEYEKRRHRGSDAHDYEYKYTGKVFFCSGTDIWKYYRGIAKDKVIYDPGHEILDKDSRPTVRPQWRVSVNKKFEDTLKILYDRVVVESL